MKGSATIPLALMDESLLVEPGTSLQSLLPGQLAGIETHGVSMLGPCVHRETPDSTFETVWFSLEGRCAVGVGDRWLEASGEFMVRTPPDRRLQVVVAAGDRLRAIRIRRELSPHDRTHAQSPSVIENMLWFRPFSDCVPYTEAFKSPRTVSRTLLPENVVPGMAAGTVEAAGPDEVAAHRHPMLEQLFIGLARNDTTVFADRTETHFPPFSLLHIPLGSTHGARVNVGRQMRYIWVDFFSSEEGQRWLSGHKPLKP